MKFIFALLLLLRYAKKLKYIVVFMPPRRTTQSKKRITNTVVLSCHIPILQVLVEFYSETCPACKRLEPVWNRISCEVKKEFPGLVFAKVASVYSSMSK